MKRSKKLVITALVLATMIVAGGIGGTLLAAENGEESEEATRLEGLLGNVAANYLELTGEEIDMEALQSAFGQARDDMRAEALQDRLDNLVEDGVITQEEADEWSSWWELKPDISVGFGMRGHGRSLGLGASYAAMQ